jgi:hypothetical protein
MGEWPKERIEWKRKDAENGLLWTVDFINALTEIERLQLLVGELVETLDGITKNWAFDEADLTALIKEAQEAIK